MYDYSRLDERIDNELIPSINSKLMYKVDEAQAKEQPKDDLDDLPF